MSVHRNPNVALLEHAYKRWSESKGSCADEVLALFDERVEMRSVLSEELPTEIAGSHLNREGAADYFAAVPRDWEMLYFDVYQFVADRDDVVMIGRCAWRNRATGIEVDTPKVDVWHFENGRVTRFMEMFDSLGFARAIGAV